jgi:eukaryotic-like serine/threonine-protein kinase
MKLGSLSRERWIVLEPLLDFALDLEPERRSAFLTDACGSDVALRADLYALLVACDRGDGILAKPAAAEYGAMLAESAAEPLSPIADRYEIVREIGRGGMATVYLADDSKHGRQVAIKVLHGDLARLIGHDRFMREIEIAASLSHPHILPLHDSGEAGSGHPGEPAHLYYVSPYVTGESLRDRLRREPALTTSEIIRLGHEIARALDYAHRQGVIHLDIKPGNILLQDGHAIIADFGIARAMSCTTESGPIDDTPLLGTPSYMSPEQALGAPDIDGRSDVYSLGCVLYEMVAGRRPFAGATSTEAIERAHAPSAPARAPLLDRGSKELATVIMRAAAPSRDDRFRTASEMAVALTDAAPESKWHARNLRKALGATVGCALAIVAVSAAFFKSRAANHLDPVLIAVAPFDVEAAPLALRREGLVDVISRDLDRTGAGLVSFGGLLSAGDSVRASTVLLDIRTGLALAEFDQRDVLDRIDRISDSLTRAVLRELGRSRQIDMTQATSFPTPSLAALKAYLAGEQFYRGASWDSTRKRFERTIEFDSGFALANHRLAAVRQWLDRRESPDTTTYVLIRFTSQFMNGLWPNERQLARIDSLSADVFFAQRRAWGDPGAFDAEASVIERLYVPIRAGHRYCPSNTAFWELLANTRSRYDRDASDGEVDDRAIVSIYDHAIALDSGFAPAYVAPLALAAYIDRPERARQYVRGIGPPSCTAWRDST